MTLEHDIGRHLSEREPRAIGFDGAVAPRGYRWFYVDCVSDDGETALVIIAMLGCPFSPAYARGRAVGADPLDHSAWNVSIHRRGLARWALTERPSHAVHRTSDTLVIGRSSMSWTTPDRLAITIDERSAPWGRPIRGSLVFRPEMALGTSVLLDRRGRHVWSPMSPLGRVSVSLDEPALRFEGSGYLDANAGDEPLEDAFRSWTWARLSSESATTITYDVVLRDGARSERGWVLDERGLRSFEAGEVASLGRTRFGLRRPFRHPTGLRGHLVRTIEDGPFYARSVVQCRSHSEDGGILRGMHETLSLDRLTASWVQRLVPFRMRRESR